MDDKVTRKLYWHAEQCYPYECCGFIRNTTSGPELVPSTNVHEDPRNHFRMPPEFFVAHSVGAICMYHSHPDGKPQPSIGDIGLYRSTCLPQLIVNWPQGMLGLYGRLSNGMYGRPFIYGVYDCLSLVRTYYAEVKGIELQDYIRPRYGWWEHEDADPFTKYYHHAGFVEVTDSPREGDIALMKIAGASRPNHVGVIVGDSRILHHRLNSLSGRTPYGGYYKDKTVAVLRYAD